jgi:putative tricarboxylic transport membrane protein
MGALMMNGLIPGPMLFKENPQFVWTVIASFFIGNLILLILNLPCIPIWVAVLKIPYSILLTLILGFCVVGAYSLSNSVFDIGAMLAFGVVGYLFKKLDIPSAPLVLTLILGPLMERGLRQSLEMSRGDFSIFFVRPLSAVLLGIAAIVIITSTFRAFAPVRGADSQI